MSLMREREKKTWEITTFRHDRKKKLNIDGREREMRKKKKNKKEKQLKNQKKENIRSMLQLEASGVLVLLP